MAGVAFGERQPPLTPLPMRVIAFIAGGELMTPLRMTCHSERGEESASGHRSSVFDPLNQITMPSAVALAASGPLCLWDAHWIPAYAGTTQRFIISRGYPCWPSEWLRAPLGFGVCGSSFRPVLPLTFRVLRRLSSVRFEHAQE